MSRNVKRKKRREEKLSRLNSWMEYNIVSRVGCTNLKEMSISFSLHDAQFVMLNLDKRWVYYEILYERKKGSHLQLIFPKQLKSLSLSLHTRSWLICSLFSLYLSLSPPSLCVCHLLFVRTICVLPHDYYLIQIQFIYYVHCLLLISFHWYNCIVSGYDCLRRIPLRCHYPNTHTPWVRVRVNVLLS